MSDGKKRKEVPTFTQETNAVFLRGLAEPMFSSVPEADGLPCGGVAFSDIVEVSADSAVDLWRTDTDTVVVTLGPEEIGTLDPASANAVVSVLDREPRAHGTLKGVASTAIRAGQPFQITLMTQEVPVL